MRRFLRVTAALGLAAVAGAALLVAAILAWRSETVVVRPPGAARVHYLIDLPREHDAVARTSLDSHVLVFNPGAWPVAMEVTVYDEEGDPWTFPAVAAPRATTELELPPGPRPAARRLALRIASDRAVFCQATVGWTNTGGDYRPDAPTLSARGRREAAKSYLAVGEPARRWYLPDGMTIEAPWLTWIREREWLLVLNPGDVPAQVRLDVFDGRLGETAEWTVPPRALRRFPLEGLAPWNRHYGARVAADVPVVAQWQREVYGTEEDGLMAFWSLPAHAADPVEEGGGAAADGTEGGS